MASDPPKFFRHQSGLMQAVRAEMEDILEITKKVTTEMTSQPPPAAVLRRPSPGGAYSMVAKDCPVDTTELPSRVAAGMLRLGEFSIHPHSGDDEET